jgi:hypothetical protein
MCAMPHGLAAIGGIMQKFFYQLNEDDRRIAQKWRWVSVAFYGSILGGMMLYAALHWNPEVNYASVDSTLHAKVVSTSKH